MRSLANQQQFIRAIVDAADSEQETEFVEWKVDVDLADKEWQATVGRHILGFANRHPDEAARWFEGCAYLVLGAAPGLLKGTDVHDIAKLDAWVSAYVGDASDAPQWSAAYVAMDSESVLLITVEAPRWGDPIWTLQKEFTPARSRTPWRAGTIFVRRRGSTEQASPSDVRMLTQRASSGSRRLGLSLELTADDAAVALDTVATVIEAWASAEKRALEPPAPPTAVDVALGRADPHERQAAVLAAMDAAIKSSLRFTEPRTRQAFAEEVDAYVSKGRESLPAAMTRGAIRHGLGRLRIWLTNHTEHNFRQVAVEFHLPEPGVKAYFDESDVEGPVLPRRPAPWDSRKATDLLGLRGIGSTAWLPALSTPVHPPLPRGHIDNGGSSRIQFVPVDVRPGHSHRLDDVYVVTGPELADGSIGATWIATATDTSGIAQGLLAVPAKRGPTDVALLLAPPARKEDHDE